VWLGPRHITADAITIGLIFMAAGMLLTRSAILLLRSRALPGGTASIGHPGSRAVSVTGAGPIRPQGGDEPTEIRFT